MELLYLCSRIEQMNRFIKSGIPGMTVVVLGLQALAGTHGVWCGPLQNSWRM